MIRNEAVQLKNTRSYLLFNPEKQEKLPSKKIEHKLRQLDKILNEVQYTQCIIFAHTHATAQRTSVFLTAKGFMNTLLRNGLSKSL